MILEIDLTWSEIWRYTSPTHATNTSTSSWCANVSLAVESWKLWLILKEVILTVLHYHFVVEASDTHNALAFRLGIFVSIFHFLFSLIHMTWADWLHFLVERTTQDVFSVFNVETIVSLTLRLMTFSSLWHETIIICLMVIWTTSSMAVTLIFIRILVL